MQPILFIAGSILIIIGLSQIFRRKGLALLLLVFGLLSVAIAFITAPKDRDEEIGEVSILRIAGSKTIGLQLMPDLVIHFLERKGYMIINKEEQIDKVIYTSKREESTDLLKVEILSVGSVKGFEILKKGDCEIAMASDEMPEAIQKALGGDYSLQAHELAIAYDAIEVIVHPWLYEFISELNMEQLQQILLGQIVDWKELNGAVSGNIKAALRDSSSGTFLFLNELFLNNGNLGEQVQQIDYFEQIISKVENDSFAIGFIHIGLDSLLLENIRVLAIGTEVDTALLPKAAPIENGQYPLARRLYLYSHSNSAQNQLVRDFFDFCRSKVAEKEIRKNGLYPIGN